MNDRIRSTANAISRRSYCTKLNLPGKKRSPPASPKPDLEVTSWIRLIVVETRVSFVIWFGHEIRRLLSSELKAERSIVWSWIDFLIGIFLHKYVNFVPFTGKHAIKISKIYEYIFNDCRWNKSHTLPNQLKWNIWILFWNQLKWCEHNLYLKATLSTAYVYYGVSSSIFENKLMNFCGA